MLTMGKVMPSSQQTQMDTDGSNDISSASKEEDGSNLQEVTTSELGNEFNTKQENPLTFLHYQQNLFDWEQEVMQQYQQGKGKCFWD